MPRNMHTSWFSDRFAGDYERKITTKWIGWVIRKKLRLTTHKGHAGFVIPLTEMPKLKRLFERYGQADAASSERAD